MRRRGLFPVTSARESYTPKGPTRCYDANGNACGTFTGKTKPCPDHPDCTKHEIRWPDFAWTWACDRRLMEGPDGTRQIRREPMSEDATDARPILCTVCIACTHYQMTDVKKACERCKGNFLRDASRLKIHACPCYGCKNPPTKAA